MIFIRILSGIISVTIAALAGNWAGSRLRFILTGRPSYGFQSVYTTTRGATIRNIPVITKFYPALLFVMVGKPRWLFAFIGGFLSGSLVDDSYEKILLEKIDQAIISQKMRPESETTNKEKT